MQATTIAGDGLRTHGNITPLSAAVLAGVRGTIIGRGAVRTVTAVSQVRELPRQTYNGRQAVVYLLVTYQEVCRRSASELALRPPGYETCVARSGNVGSPQCLAMLDRLGSAQISSGGQKFCL